MTDAQKTLIIKDFNKAVADGPHVGHALMRNIDVEQNTGSMKAKVRLKQRIMSCNQNTFTADAPTDVCTAGGSMTTSSMFAQGLGFGLSAVTFTTTGTLPAGLSLATVYYLIYLSDTTFKVATTWANANAGTAIDITNAGSGVHTVVPVPIGTINVMRHNLPAGAYYAIDSNGRVWTDGGNVAFYLLTGNSLTNASGLGLEIFKNANASATYLFVFRNHLIDYISLTTEPLAASTAWTTAWNFDGGGGGLNTGAGTSNSHESRLGQDNIIYFCDDHYVGSIMEVAGQNFDPTSSATYAVNTKALTLPLTEVAQSLEELNLNLLTGGLTFNKIYPWDRTSPSFSFPIPVPEVGIYKMKNAGNLVYILAGTKGNIYTTQGSYATLFKSIPGYVKNNANVVTSAPVTWGGIALRSGILLFGMQTQTSGNSGVWNLFPDKRILQDNTPYSGSTNATAILAENDFYFIGYNGGLDSFDSVRPSAQSYASVYQSALYRVGDKTKKAAYSQVEVQTAKPAVTGAIRIGYRLDTASAFTTSAASTFSADGATTSYQNSEFSVINVENFQLQIEFDSDIEIVEVRLSP